MNSETPENEPLARQVHELQQELRRMKQFGIAGVVVIVLLLLLHLHDHRKLSTDELIARSVTLADVNGVVRGRMAVFPEGAGLEIYASSGERRVQLVGRGEGATLNLNIPVTATQDSASVNLLHDNVLLSSFRANPDGAAVELHSKVAKGSAVLSLQGTTASLMLAGADEQVPRVWLSADRNQACTSLTGQGGSPAGSSLCLHSPGLPALELADLSGNRAVVGIPHSAEMNGDKGSSEGSAASLILKHKSGSKVQVKPETPAAQ
jgi:hypothetical protein